MKKLLLIILMVLTASSFSKTDRWKYFATSSDNTEWYYDSESINYPDPDMKEYEFLYCADIWVKWIFSTGEEKILHITFYCNERKLTVDNSLIFFESIKPETILEELFKILCKNYKF